MNRLSTDRLNDHIKTCRGRAGRGIMEDELDDCDEQYEEGNEQQQQQQPDFDEVAGPSSRSDSISRGRRSESQTFLPIDHHLVRSTPSICSIGTGARLLRNIILQHLLHPSTWKICLQDRCRFRNPACTATSTLGKKRYING